MAETAGSNRGAAADLRAALLLNEGHVSEARSLLERAMTDATSKPELHLLACNAFGGDPAKQLERLNAFFAAYDLSPVALVHAGEPPSPTNLNPAGVVPSVANGPLISVLMTTHNTARWVKAAIDAVLGQSWLALELIVIDDSSDDDTWALVQQRASLDRRVLALRLPRNAGTYVAKHIGLQHARGDFVTCHDSDDWSHPLKIERQVRPLVADRRLVATASCWVRMTQEGLYYARQVHPLMRLNPSSLMFRREDVLSNAGAWDVVRTGADSEFLERLKQVYGRKSVLRVSQPLSLGSHRASSLMTDPATGYCSGGLSPVREAYSAAWAGWHADLRSRRAKPWMKVDPLAVAQDRPFPIPAELRVPPEVIASCLSVAGVPGFMQGTDQGPRWVASRALARVESLPALMGGELVGRGTFGSRSGRVAGVLAWGRKPSSSRAESWAASMRLPLLRIEDGFLRSLATGDLHPPLALVADRDGIYYDSTRPSSLEKHLGSDADLLAGRAPDVARARALIVDHGLSKYNHAPAVEALDAETGKPLLRQTDSQRILVVDQTAGDMSVALGGANAQTFADMLAAALEENPSATVYVKTHPEVASGRKAGHFQQLRSEGRVVVVREAVEPLSLVRRMDRVYVVSSTLGFEALLAGKPVTCFGLPWYAGWGATDDRQLCPRRTRRRTVDELFAAAYFDYTRYLDPRTGRRGTIFDVIDWLARQKQMRLAMRGPNGSRRLICVGFRRWKAANLRPILAGALSEVVFVADPGAARALQPRSGDWLVFWGAVPPPGLLDVAADHGAEAVRVEDGFVRSIGLGSDLIAPRSLVLDPVGIYFDPSRPSALENLLNAAAFSAQELEDARAAREFIVANGLTKYNLEPRRSPGWDSRGRRVVLVPGQVESDASIRLGCSDVRTNAGLLRAARAACPEAFIVYKPHPDVTSGNRDGRLAIEEARRWADHVETRVSVVSCVEACHEVHTMTSLAGFDALLRGKKVVVYGQPFYAGWGLTQDVLPPHEAAALARRQRRLALDELVAGALLRYPLYWDPALKGYTTCMAVLQQLAAGRDALERNGGLERLRTGWWRRQLRKARILFEAWRR